MRKTFTKVFQAVTLTGKAAILAAAVGASAPLGAIDLSVLDNLQYSTSAASDGRRLELRAEGTVGHALVSGTEYKGDPNGGAATAWNIASLATGWQTLTSGTNAAAILKLDPQSTAIEGGRLQSNAMWDSSKTHVVRNWVTVPSGVTLTISQGTIVKFCESAGIKVLSGGKVQINGAEGADVFFASIGNDTYGGDTNLRVGDFETNSYEIVTLNGGTWSDNGYWVTPDAQLRGYPEVTLHDSLASVSDGVARVPVTVEGTRNAPFSIDWALEVDSRTGCQPVQDLNALAARSTGTLSWTASDEGTKYVEIPLKSTYTPSGVESFIVRATLARSVTRVNETAQVKVFKGGLDVASLQYSTSAASDGRRLELRAEGTVGHALVNGTEYKGDPNGGAATAWNIASLATGWQTLTSGTNSAAILKLDPATTAIEGGRLQSNATWDSAKIHVVRNWVTVPSGVTLTITDGTIVKFCESAGIKVLSGGKVQINGAEGADVFFASIGNDTYGGDTNLRAGDFETNSYKIVTLNGGTWSDNGYWVTPDAAVRPYPEVALHDAIGAVEGGVVRVPVSVEGTRNAPFSIDWQITGAPFTSTSGTLTWSQSSEGTKFIEIPIKANYSPNGTESFALSATRARSVNLSNETVRVSVYSGHIAVGDVIENGESTPSAGTEIETRGIGGTMIAKALERITYSPRWSNAASCTVDLGGSQLTATEEGSATWSRPSTPGLYTFTHKAGGETLTARFAVLGDDVAVHAGTLETSETWGADKTHLVIGTVTVKSGVTLTIEPGAVVKFMPGAKLIVEAGGTCIAKGVKFTHAYDDAVGGDTLYDGAATLPVMEDYEIKGVVTDDGETEYRYTAPVVLSGTITANTTWRGWKVYNVTGNLTIKSGVTLTVEPGAVVKFNSGVSLTVSSGATLNAIGTRAQPIIFTSIKDDEYGGDTNGDGEKTYPWAGDWARIYAGGTLNMNYCRIRYCNNNSDQGAIQGSGGTVLFDNGIIEASTYECVRMNSGKFTAHNSVFRDASMGFGYYGGSGVYVYNCVVADCTIACRASNKHFYNTVFYNCYTFLESTSSSCDHCVFYNEPGLGAQSATQVGSNGNIWGDPMFVDAENGDFRIQKGSPCINAGDAVNAPEFDYYGQPRDDGAPDIGIYELPGGMSANDLAAVGGPRYVAAATTIGDTLTVAYEIANVGKQAINGSWRDKVSLVSADGGYSIDLGTVVQTAALAVRATNTFNASFTVPTDAEGSWRVQVGVNVERDIYEGANVTNNVATSEGTVEVSLPARAASDGFSGTATKGAPASAKFALDGAEPMVARINAPVGTVVYFGSGFMPSASTYSARAVVGADGGLIGIPAGVTSAYLLVETTSSKGVAFTMTLESAALAVQSVTPATLPYTGTTGLVIDGANFAEGCRVELTTAGGSQLAATATTLVSPTRLTAQIDCSRLTAGATYDVKVVGADGATATLPNAVTVANVPAAPKLRATLDAPASVRRGRTLTVYIDYENVGNADLPAPIFELISEGQVFKIEGTCYTNSVKVMGLSSEAPVGTLRPGEPQRIGIPVTILAENVKWKLKSYHAAQEGAKKRLQLEALMGERWVRDLARSDTNLYYAVCSLIGKTWAECYNRMGNSLSEKLEANAYILTFDEAVEIFVKDAYEKAKNSKESKSRGRVLSAGPNLLTGNAVTWISEEGELTGRDCKDDNSHDGDVWWLKKYSENIGGVPTVHYHWYSITNASVRTELSGKLDNVFLICHGNANSVHEPWIEKLAKDAISAGYTAVLAVDWGDGSCSHLAVNPEKNSTYIPAAGAEAIRQLQKVGVAGGNLTICGHSHGGHLGGIIAKGMGAKRLIGMDTSPIWTHENTPAKNRYPLGWSRSSANTIEFYKSSWHYSMGTDPTDEGNGPIFGIPSFYVTQEGDFYNDDYVRGGRKRGKGWLKNFKALSRHGFSYEWVTAQMSLVKTMNWKDSSKTWQQLSGSTSGLPDAGLFAGVIREGLMECGSQVRKAVADTLGVDMYAVKWNYDEYMFNNGHKPGTLMILQEKFVQISEHGLDGMYYTSDEFKTGQTYDWLLEGVQNYADNTSIDYNHSTLKDVDKPWDKGFGIAIFIADVSDFSSTLYNGITEGNTSSSGGRLKWVDIEALKNAGVRFELISSKCDASAFVRPGEKANDTGVVKMNGAIPESVFTGSDGLGDEKDGRLCLVVGAVGIVGTQGDAQLKLYEGELCPDNNFFARLIRVKSDGPTSDVLSGTALHFEWSYEQVSAFAPENIQDDNTWTADENGNWTVTLTGATSYGPTNIVAGSWTGFDCTVSQREWTPNPNVTVTGHLFTGEDGDFVPAQDYTVILAVEDANGKIGTKEYKFTIKRHVDEDPGEDEDAGGSNEPKSCDPNEMVGEEGVGEARFVKPGQELTYTIYFENKSDADAAAACVEVFNPLNEWLDWSSLTMLDVGYNNNVDNGLGGLHEGVSEKAMDGTNVSVRTEFAVAYYDEAGNELDENALAARSTMEGVYARAEWYLRIIDPNGDSEGWPLDMTGGFLPPNNEETHCGEGYIRYKVKVRDDAPGNVVITNSATIIFDHWDEDALVTDPAWWNTVRSPGAQFSAPEVVADEGGAAEIRVSGGNAESASSVKVYLTYNTAVAADVDVAKGAVSDATERVPPEGGSPSLATAKGLKFPLALSWEKGEMGEKVITIPVKTDKTVEGDEFFTLQLAEAQGMELGEERVCTVTIRDATVAAGKETLQDAVNNAVVKMSTSGKGKWAYANVGTGGEAAPGKTASASAMSPILKSGQTADLKAAAVKGSGTLTFDVRVANPNLEGESPEVVEGAAKTVLTLLDGKADLLAWTNETDWTSASYTVEEVKATSHAFTWRVVQGTDTNARAYVANVVWSPVGTEMRALTLAAASYIGGEPCDDSFSGGTVSGEGVYPDKTKISLAATTKVGWEFVGWARGGRGATALPEILSNKAKWQVVVTNDAEYVAVFEKIPYVRGLADPADGGKVSDSGLCARGKKVTLKATANKNYTFLGWVRGGRGATALPGDGDGRAGSPLPAAENGFVATTPSLVIDRSAKPAANSKTSTTVTEIDGDVTYFAVFKSDPKVTVSVESTKDEGAVPTGKGAGKYVAGTITGTGKYAPGKKVTLKATANKGYVFAGWYDGAVNALAARSTSATGETPVVPVSQAASLSFEMPSNDVEYVAMFVTAEEDKASIALAVDGTEMRLAGDGSPHQTNIWAGVYLEWPVVASALSEPKVKVAGLPSGLKFTDKPVTSKTGSGKTAVTVTNVLANTIYGAPTAASKIDKNTGAAKPSAVKITVTTAGKSSQTYQIDTVVDALPAWAQGTFAGGGRGATALPGQVSLTVSAAGKVSGKALGGGFTYTLAAPYYIGFEEADGVSNFVADLTASWSYKEGTKTVKTNDVVQVAVADNGIGGYAATEDWFEAYTVNWKVEPWKTLGKSFDKKTMTYAILPDGSFSEAEDVLTSALGADVTARVTLKFAASGAVTVAGEFVTGYNEKKRKFTTVKASGSATLVPVDNDHGEVFIYLTPKGLAPHARCVEVPWPEE